MRVAVERRALRPSPGLLAVVVGGALLVSGCGGQRITTHAASVQAAGAEVQAHLSGSGSRRLGVVRILPGTVIAWRTTGHHFEIRYATRRSELRDPGSTGTVTGGPTGTLRAQPGTYERVRVVTDGRWTITVEHRHTAPASRHVRVTPAPPSQPVRRFAGTGPTRLGVARIKPGTYVQWTTTGSFFEIRFAPKRVGGSVMSSTGARGSHAGGIGAIPGTYRNVRVVTDGHWTLSVQRVPGPHIHG